MLIRTIFIAGYRYKKMCFIIKAKKEKKYLFSKMKTIHYETFHKYQTTDGL